MTGEILRSDEADSSVMSLDLQSIEEAIDKWVFERNLVCSLSNLYTFSTYFFRLFLTNS